MRTFERILTGVGPDGHSCIIATEPVAPVEVAALPGSRYFRFWGSADGGADPTGPAVHDPYFPGPAGTRCVVVRFPPAREAIPATGDSTALRAEMDTKLPGMAAAFGDERSGMHRTASLDYGLCLSGELWLRLDGGDERCLTPGSLVVQRATAHAWENRSDEAAFMLFVLIGGCMGR